MYSYKKNEHKNVHFNQIFNQIIRLASLPQFIN